METIYSKDFNKIPMIAEEMYQFILHKDTEEIIASVKMNTRTESDLHCTAFYTGYKISLYNTIWSFINMTYCQKIKKS
jgi:hypothetical protein